MFKKPDAVRKERYIEGNNEAAVSNDTSRTEGARDDWITEEGGIVKNKTKLRFIAKIALEPELIKNDFGKNNKHQHN